MVKAKVTIKNTSGLHLRPAGILCNEAVKYQSQITFSHRNNVSNAKSVLSVLGACIKCGDEITVECAGESEADDLKTIIDAIASGLGE